ncbi:ChrR family anti-sigma-E factor [Sneathiella sp.]|jgi:putative transcriptional regulator|uniref:ChrR family anti-sigma-E factor n=1 Tax=Sneathiella sp. TaxID=1964365 RepID=UPI0039E70CF1
MNTIKHHIGDDTLMAYVNGTLTETISVVVATHLALCPECRKNVQLMEDIAALYLVDSEPGGVMSTPPSVDMLEQDDPSADLSFTTEYVDKGVPAPLASQLPMHLEDIPWKKLIPGVSHYPLSVSNGSRKKGVLRLLKISPGTPIPEHSHTGQEITMILKGSYIDELGRFQSGDIADLDSTITHQPVADTDKDCICLIATDAPLKFSGFFSKLLQPLVGI